MAAEFNFPKSKFIKSFEWQGERIPYPEPQVRGDTFPMTWGSDDAIYTSAGDPGWGTNPDGFEDVKLKPVKFSPFPGSPNWGECFTGLDVEKITGGPTDYQISKINNMNDFVGWGGAGPKPTGMICVDGILYLAFQNLLGARPCPYSLRSQSGSDAHIIFAEIGAGSYVWTPAVRHIEKPMFPGHQFGGPSFINFGKNNQNARDEYVYAVSSDQWDNGSNLRLGRVPTNSIIRREAWEWVCAWTPSCQPVWSHDLGNAIPILSLHRCISLPDMVYIEAIKRYLLLNWRLHEDFDFSGGTDLMIFESPEPWGPFSLVHYENDWEFKDFTPYCPRLPLKWMDADGLGGYIQFSGKPGHPQYYRSNVRKFRLTLN